MSLSVSLSLSLSFVFVGLFGWGAVSPVHLTAVAALVVNRLLYYSDRSVCYIFSCPSAALFLLSEWCRGWGGVGWGWVLYISFLVLVVSKRFRRWVRRVVKQNEQKQALSTGALFCPSFLRAFLSGAVAVACVSTRPGRQKQARRGT